MTEIIRTGPAAGVPDAAGYRGYEDLARAQRRGVDYEIVVRRRHESRVAVIAPHAGGIENGTSGIARAIAGEDLNLYLFEGRRAAHNFRALHLTSHRFDEPDCLRLIAACTTVVAVHGCAGAEPRIYLGGRDRSLRDGLASALRGAGFEARIDGHRFPAVRFDNVCNRGATGRGVQVELTEPLRDSRDSLRVAATIRATLAAAAPCSCTIDQLLCGAGG